MPSRRFASPPRSSSRPTERRVIVRRPPRAAADAAVAVREAQVGGDADAYAKAVADLDDSLDMLAQVALAHLAKEGAAPTDAMRRRLRDLLRNAAADDEAREDLARGVLTGEVEVTGFAAYAGVAVTPKPKGRAPATKGPSRAEQAQERRRERMKELRAELAAAERELREATAAARAAERDRVRAEKAVASLRKKLDETRLARAFGPLQARGPGGRAPCSMRRNFGPGGSACGERSRASGRYLFHILMVNGRFSRRFPQAV